MGDVMREPQTGQGDRRLSGEWGGGGRLAEQTGLLCWLRTKPPLGGKICVGHFCNSKRLGPALAPDGQ